MVTPLTVTVFVAVLETTNSVEGLFEPSLSELPSSVALLVYCTLPTALSVTFTL